MYSIILIDDEYFFRNSLRKNFDWEDCGFEVVGDANNGNKAYELIKEKKPHAALLDINMPNINGIQLLERLNSENIDCKCIFLTGYDDFEYAKSALRFGAYDYLLKPVDFDELKKSLERINNLLSQQANNDGALEKIRKEADYLTKRQILNDIVSAHIVHGIEQITADANIPLYNNVEYIVAVASIDTQLNTDHLKQATIALQMELFATEICFADYKNNLCIIMAKSELTELFVSLMADAITRTIGSAKLSFGGGCKLHELSMSYNRAYYGLKYCNERNNNIYHYSHAPSIRFVFYPTEYKSRLLSAMSRYDTQEVSSILSQIFQNIDRDKITDDNLVFICLDLLCMLLQMGDSLSVDYVDSTTIQTTLTEKILSFPTLIDVKEWITATFIDTLFRVTPEKNGAEISAKVTEYININYHNKDLSVSDISKYCFLNYSYLCSAFKKEKGTTINGYIQDVRLNKAKELFGQGHENIAIVAEKTGFVNANYFSKWFKNNTGITPTDYIRINNTQCR